MAFDNGVTTISNNARLRSIHRRPKILNTPNYRVAPYRRNNEPKNRGHSGLINAKKERIKKLLNLFFVGVVALTATSYLIYEFLLT